MNEINLSFGGKIQTFKKSIENQQYFRKLQLSKNNPGGGKSKQITFHRRNKNNH